MKLFTAIANNAPLNPIHAISLRATHPNWKVVLMPKHAMNVRKKEMHISKSAPLMSKQLVFKEDIVTNCMYHTQMQAMAFRKIQSVQMATLSIGSSGTSLHRHTSSTKAFLHYLQEFLA